MNASRKYIVPGVTGLVLVALFSLTIVNFFFRSKSTAGTKMVQDIKTLATVFHRIDAECGIIDFDHQKNSINFLNVIAFKGSEVGSMNLRHPEKWQGAYLNDNPTMQDQEYQVVYTKKGYFITPGEGVKLPNGKVIGKDIIFDENADIDALARDGKDLSFEGNALAAPLKMTGNGAPVDQESDLEM